MSDGIKLRLRNVSVLKMKDKERYDWRITLGTNLMTLRSLRAMLHNKTECQFEHVARDFQHEGRTVTGIQVFRDLEYDLLMMCGVNPHVSKNHLFLTTEGSAFLYLMCDYSLEDDAGGVRYMSTNKTVHEHMCIVPGGDEMFRNAVFYNQMMHDHSKVMDEMKGVLASKQEALCAEIENSVKTAKNLVSTRSDFHKEYAMVKPFMTKEKLMHVNKMISDEASSRKRKRDEKARLQAMMRQAEETDDLSACQSTLELSFKWLGTVRNNRLFNFHKVMVVKSWTFCEQVLTFWMERGDDNKIFPLLDASMMCESPAHADVVGYYKYWKYIMRMASDFTDHSDRFGPHKSWLARLKVALRCPLDEHEDYEFALQTANCAVVQRDSRMERLAARLRLKIVENNRTSFSRPIGESP